MGKDKIALMACFCLIVALVGFSVWLYVGAIGLESKVGDLQITTNNLATQNAELSTKVQNLSWMLGNLTSRSGAFSINLTKADQFDVASVAFMGASPSYAGINMSIQNIGSSAWTVTSPAQINSNTNVPVTYTGTGANSFTCGAGKSIYVLLIPAAGFLISGNQYAITLLLSDGNKITYVATAP